MSAIAPKAGVDQREPDVGSEPRRAYGARAKRQSIIDALPGRESGKSKDWNEGFDAAIAGVIAVLVERSFTHRGSLSDHRRR